MKETTPFLSWNYWALAWSSSLISAVASLPSRQFSCWRIKWYASIIFNFTSLTVISIFYQLHRVEGLHACDYIHRDIKPDNFLMGRGINERQLYLIDFGLSKKFCDGSLINPTRRHIPFRNGKSLTGTARYASLNAHEGSGTSSKLRFCFAF